YARRVLKYSKPYPEPPARKSARSHLPESLPGATCPEVCPDPPARRSAQTHLPGDLPRPTCLE
ncbi:hypothetical protein Dimus_001205, partial [Dionaea muscipula]